MSLSVHIKKQLGKFSLQASFMGKTGEVTGLLGASGSGKTVTLQCIAGLMTPDEGRIELDGQVLFDHQAGINLPPQQRRVGYLFQQYALFPHYTVERNIAVACEDRDEVERLLHCFHLEEHRKKRPHQLSGGQQQRVALARILASKPRLFLLDEPFSALDTHLRREVQRELSKFFQRFSGPCMMVTHSQEDVKRLCHRVCVVDNGVTQAMQETAEFFARPHTPSACRLMGCPNISPVVQGENGMKYASDWGIAVEVPPGTSHVAIHPHHLRLRSSPEPGCVHGECTHIEVGLFAVRIEVTCSGGTLLLELPLHMWANVKNTRSVWVELPQAHLIALFDE